MKSLETLADLESAIAASSIRPVVVFKHSLTCGTSARALAQIESLVASPSLDADIVIVPVQTARDVSNAIAERFTIRHETPQVVVIHAGQSVWHASHWRVTADGVLEAVRKVAALPLGPTAALL